MMRLPILLLLLATALGLPPACGPGPDPRPLIERAAAAVDPDAKVGGTLYLRQEGEFEPSSDRSTKVPYVVETLLVLPGRIVSRTTVAGLTTVKCVDGGQAWVRIGAAVDDLVGDAAREERAERDDLIALLVRPLLDPAFHLTRTEDRVTVARTDETPRTLEFDAESGLPTRLERLSRNTRGNTGKLVRSYSGWTRFGPILFPTAISMELGGSRLRLTTRALEFNPPDSRGLPVDRPRDQAETRTGPIRRVPEPGGNYLAVRTQGSYVQLATADVLLEHGIKQVIGNRLGPNRRLFHDLPGKDGISVVTTMVPVHLEVVEQKRFLPNGVEVTRLTETETLAMTITGPYPQDRSLERILVNYGEDLGLEATGPARYLILSDPDAGDPADLEMEIRLPVRGVR